MNLENNNYNNITEDIENTCQKINIPVSIQ